MRIFRIIPFVLLLATPLFAAVPQALNYQGYLKNSDGTPVNTATNVTFSLYSSISGAGAVWSSGVVSVTPANGVYSLQLGQPPQPALPSFDRPYWLGVTAGDTDPEMRPLQPLTSAPYALRANVADSLAAGAVTTAAIADGAVTDAKLTGPVADGKLSTNVALLDNTQIITGVKVFNPSSGSVPFAVDAGRNALVTNLNADMLDGKHASDFATLANLADYVAKAGDTMSGTLTVSTSGTASAGVFQNTNANNDYSDALYGWTNSTFAHIAAVKGYNAGTGYGVYGFGGGIGVYGNSPNGNSGFFNTWNSANPSDTLRAETTSTNVNVAAVKGRNIGGGYAGRFEIASSGNSSDALYATTNGTGNAGNFQGKVTVSGNLTVGGTISGNGSGLTNLTAGALPANVALLDTAQTVTGAKTFSSPVTVNSNISAASNSGNVITSTITSGPGIAVLGTTIGSGYGVEGATTGSGSGGFFQTSGPGNGIVGLATGVGTGVYGITYGTGRAGRFEISNASSTADALYATTNGTGNAGNFQGKVNVSGTVIASLFSGSGAALSGVVKTHAGAVYRWTEFDTYANAGGWLAGNDPAMFGGVAPLNWTENNWLASQMSADKEVLRTLFTRKGYGGKNAVVNSKICHQYSSTTGHVSLALFRIKNTTASVIPWSPYFWYTAYSSWGETASVALNGASIWSSGSSAPYGSQVAVTMPIPAGRTSTVIFVVPSGSGVQIASGIFERANLFAFYNNSLNLPAGLEYVDDLDTATGGWEQ